MAKPLIIQGQRLELPTSPLKKALDELLIPRGFSTSPLDYVESKYQGEIPNAKSPSWITYPERSFEIFTRFLKESQQIYYTLTIDEYRLFEKPITILKAQYYENIILKENKEPILKISKSPNTMVAKFFDTKRATSIERKSIIESRSTAYNLNTFVSYLANTLDRISEIE